MPPLRLVCTLIVSSLVAPAQAAGPSEFLKGGFRLGAEGRSVTLMNPPLAAPVLFRLYCEQVVDGATATFRITHPDGSSTARLSEEGGALVHTTQISIEQMSPGQPNLCTWTAYENTVRPPVTARWTAFPGQSHRALAASFTSEHAFVFSFDRYAACSDVQARLWVDGSVMEDADGNAQTLWQGNTVYSRGRLVEVELVGDCGSAGPLAGSIAVRGW